MQTRWSFVGGLSLCVSMAVWWWITAPDASERPIGEGERVRWSASSQFTHVSSHDTSASAQTDASPSRRSSGDVRTAEDIEQLLFAHGSLRGTSLDGDWGVDAHGQLQPSRALRRRFDQLLTTQGEVSRDELGVWLRNKATQDVGANAAQAISDVWHRYLLLEGQDYRYTIRPNDPESLRWALQERQVKRRELLGHAWAHAFYAEEEAVFTEILASRHSASAATPSAATHAAQPHLSAAQTHAMRSAEFGVAAADRLAALDREEAQWQARLAQARAQWASTRNAVHLSATQQEDSFAQWLAAHFDAQERVRIQALLGL